MRECDNCGYSFEREQESLATITAENERLRAIFDAALDETPTTIENSSPRLLAGLKVVRMLVAAEAERDALAERVRKIDDALRLCIATLTWISQSAAFMTFHGSAQMDILDAKRKAYAALAGAGS